MRSRPWHNRVQFPWFENERESEEDDDIPFSSGYVRETGSMLEMLKRNTRMETLTSAGGSKSAFRIGHENGLCSMKEELCLDDVQHDGKTDPPDDAPQNTESSQKKEVLEVQASNSEQQAVGDQKEKTLREKVIALYQRGVDFFTERANNAEKVMEEAQKRGISPDKLLKHMDKKYPYGRADFTRNGRL